MTTVRQQAPRTPPRFKAGTNEQTGLDDLVALEAYLGAHNPYTPVETVRVTRVN